MAQQSGDSNKQMPLYKNIIRYNLSGALIFGFGNYIVFGYERMVAPRQSFSVNVGRAALPKLINIETDSFRVQHEGKRTGYNLSVDYRFYLAKENKFAAPHGLYLGPYYSYNHFENDKRWTHVNRIATNQINTTTKLNIHTIGFELGYQFILGKHLAIDVVMVGPGLGFYKYNALFEGNVTMNAGTKNQVLDALKQWLIQKFPGMNTVFGDKEFDAHGILKTSDVGYRYIVHIGYSF